MDTLLLFTNKGNFIYAPVYTIPDIKWKELGKHISNIIKTETDESIVSCIKVEDFEKDIDITLATRLGMIKRTKLSEFKVSRYTKPVNCMNLKGDDELICAFMSLYNNVFVATKGGFGLWFDINDIPIVGLKTSGVKSINLKDDSVVSVNNFNELDYISVVMNKGCGKRVKLSEFEKSTRARRGLMIVREVKTSPYKIVKTFAVDSKNYLGIKTDEINEIKLTELSIMDRYSTGNNITKKKIVDAFIVCNLVKKGESNDADIKETPKPRVSLKEIDERLLTIDDYI
jgi:topoisomerase-4 subunit A